MKFRLSILMISSAALLGGCATQGSECVWTQTIMIGSVESAHWLAQNDRELLSSVVQHNEKRQEFCQ